MRLTATTLLVLTVTLCLAGQATYAGSTFKSDVDAAKRVSDDVVLMAEYGFDSWVAVSATLQGRVLTSSADDKMNSCGAWLNRAAFDAEPGTSFNAVGGEDSFWLGPEGGQFSVFFDQGATVDAKNWRAPNALDRNPFNMVRTSRKRTLFARNMDFKNRAGTAFQIRVERDVVVLERCESISALHISSVTTSKVVGFETTNVIINTGNTAWQKETGALSIRVLGAYRPSAVTTAIIPFNQGAEAELGPVFRADATGGIPADRIAEREGMLFVKLDGTTGGRIGIAPGRAKPVLGFYDAENKALTIVQYMKPEGAVDYAESAWGDSAEPNRGDAIRIYDGLAGPGEPGSAGPCFQIETASPVAALAPGGRMSHFQRTIHIQGPESDLDVVVRTVFGVGLADIGVKR